MTTRLPLLADSQVGPPDVVAAIRARRGGALLDLDRLLLHSPPFAAGWGELMGRVRGAAHCVSKAGLILLTKVLAMELAPHKIQVNAVTPGLIDVPVQRNEETLSLEYRESYVKMIPAGHMGETTDIAKAVLFLSSSDADWISGEQLIVDGGTMAGHYALGKQHDFAGLAGHT